MVYGTPVIILIGLFGNALSLVVFSCTHLERASSSLYMCLLSVADICFLGALLVVWLDRIGVSLLGSFGWCQMVVFVSHSCGFLSTWSVVSFTVERYVNVFHPLRRDTFCTKRRANVIVASLVSFALVVYAYTVFSYDTLRLGPAAVCAPRPGHHHIVTAMTAVDTFVACVVPSLFIVVLNARLIRKFRQYKVELSVTRDFGDTVPIVGSDAPFDATVNYPLVVYHAGSRAIAATIIPTSCNVRIQFAPAEGASSGNDSASHGCNRMTSVAPLAGCQRALRERCKLRKARMLLALSSVIILLGLPSHVLRTQFTVRHLFHASRRMSSVEWELHEFFQLLYFLGFAVNFFIYNMCGHQFRRELHRLCGRCRYTLCKYKSHLLRPRKRSKRNSEVWVQLERVS
ncbi:hypothetical protein NP493_160g02008 [Ridgeia piscesae]|uniref:G-protein coupled receptors family 1 profile domain-containing protein n=1 Tax=Ridgeia piscesae TaxID=27915 RepID=A0AAD9P452_RIDPI|nr:hypothetical protein NP493_160g02008 [Ridgeia piscesae]